MTNTYAGRATANRHDTSELPAVPGDRTGSWLPEGQRHLWLAAAVLAAVGAVLLLIAYGFATGQDRLMVLRATFDAATLAGVAILLGLAVRAVRTMILTATARAAGQILDQELTLVTTSWSARLAQEMRQAAREQVGELEKRVAAVETDRDRLVKEHTGYARAVLDQLGRIEAALPGRLGERLEAVERDVEQQDQEYERGWVNGAARTADALSPNGQVRHLHPKGAPPEPRRSS